MDERALELAASAAYKIDWPKDTWERLGPGYHQERYKTMIREAILVYLKETQ